MRFQSVTFISSFTPSLHSIQSLSRASLDRRSKRPQNAFRPNRRVTTSSLAQDPNSEQKDNRKPGLPEETDAERKRREIGRLFSLFSRLALPYWKAEKQARRDLTSVVALTFLQSGISVLFSFVSRDFWTALNTKNAELFYHQAEVFCAVLLAFTPVIVYYHYFRDKCALRWRDWITNRVLKQYCSNRNFYTLEAVDNPDQRIAQDLNSFTTESLALFLTLLVSAIDLVSFSTILFSIYPYLFAVLLVYASTGTYLTAVLGKRLIGLNYNQIVREADLRYGLIRMRENAESIAFFNGEKRENAEITRRLKAAIENMSDVIDLRRQVGFLQTGYKYAVRILPAFLVAPRYFAGAIELGSVTQSMSAFSHILDDLSLVVNRFDSLSQFGAGIDRLAQFVQALEDNIEEEQRTFGTNSEKNLTRGRGHRGGIVLNEIPGRNRFLSVQNLTLYTPGDDMPRKLIDNLSFTLTPGERLLVCGPSGNGKSSLLRALAGLWTNGSGIITCPDHSELFFLPQKPYCTLGSLRDNLVYPKDVKTANFTDAALLRALDLVELSELPSRMGGLDAVADWGDVLSLGEQQRLQFARLFLSGTGVAIIDEGTSALSVQIEKAMYELVLGLGATIVSVGHRPTLLGYHERILRLWEGSWELADITQAERDDVVMQTLYS
ncbi:ABC transporter D family member 2, chloroplastic [Gracilariopsis chorda]|uniref:Probable ATP-dependent transporter ycf16 n=1 Tax=Gracilariopsis chorda TaxID=448386 RepID=A0A2V3IHP2_9FLOR|nr:ABC transporter D family member 2, chloroplastic [Gracilariopsis chorda]|eukprot:PXF41543.1 ABC transporter D family member 2, chloroplastic [Gracilariopsis chorda]